MNIVFFLKVILGKGEALCGKRITKDVVVNVNIKMTKKWKIKMYIFQPFFIKMVRPLIWNLTILDTRC